MSRRSVEHHELCLKSEKSLFLCLKSQNIQVKVQIFYEHFKLCDFNKVQNTKFRKIEHFETRVRT